MSELILARGLIGPLWDQEVVFNPNEHEGLSITELKLRLLCYDVIELLELVFVINDGSVFDRSQIILHKPHFHLALYVFLS